MADDGPRDAEPDGSADQVAPILIALGHRIPESAFYETLRVSLPEREHGVSVQSVGYSQYSAYFMRPDGCDPPVAPI